MASSQSLFSPQKAFLPSSSACFLPWSKARETENKKEHTLGVSAHLPSVQICRAFLGRGMWHSCSHSTKTWQSFLYSSLLDTLRASFMSVGAYAFLVSVRVESGS